MDTQTGIIGLFDILGYQNLLENNEPENIAETVVGFIDEIGTKVPSEMKQSFGIGNIPRNKKKGLINEMSTSIAAIIDSIQWLVLSDTILVVMPIQSREDYYFSIICWHFFLSTCIHLQEIMFKRGLPLRGTINYGKFYIKNNCFASREIVEAYQLCNQLEFSACVLTEKSRQELDKINGKLNKNTSNKFYDYLVLEYLVPTKDDETRMLVLAAKSYVPEREDLKSQVVESFMSYNKDIPFSIQRKVTSTEQWLIFLRQKEKK